MMQDEEKVENSASEADEAQQPSDASRAIEDFNVSKAPGDPKDSCDDSKDAKDSKKTSAPQESDAPLEEAPALEPPPAEPDWKDRYARAMADFDNFRKRTLRDKEDLAKFAASDILKDLLATVDNLALALDKAENKEDPFVAGVKLAYDGFLKTLAAHGATPLDSVGEPFDANYHEALAQLPSPDVEEGHVMNEVKRGWLLHGKLLRAAQVVVSAGKPAKS